MVEMIQGLEHKVFIVMCVLLLIGLISQQTFSFVFADIFRNAVIIIILSILIKHISR